MVTKVKPTKAAGFPDVSLEDGIAWERRNSSVLKKDLAQAWKDCQDGKGIPFDPRDPYTFLSNARKKYVKSKKATV